MKTLLVTLIVTFLALMAVPGFAAEKKKQENTKGKLVHMVAFKFKPTATKEQIKEVEDAFAALKEKIPQISSLKWGTNVSPEKHDQGYTHGFILKFKTDKDRDDYLVHPEHKKFGQLVGPVLADVFVIDFWTKK
jgi:Stress responsive A/B Barrel Domain